MKKTSGKKEISNPASPNKRIYSYSPIADKKIQISYYSKQEPQLKEYPNQPAKIENNITDAD